MINKKKCCGCTACVHICPQSCIAMVEDKMGFLYPIIDEDKCIHCGKCEKVCPSLNKGEKAQSPIFCWGGHAKLELIRKASSSGGLFTVFAEEVINSGGVVFGARMSEDCTIVYHDFVQNVEDLSVFRGSKYVQSDLKKCFPQVQENLKLGRNVLFSGTPCQIDGLRLFLKKDYSNLLTIELICHGTPSPKIFRKYIEYMTNKFNDSITKVNFRNEVGGNVSIMRIDTENGHIYQKNKNIDPYYRMFLSDTCLRESCYQCPSRGLYRRADITLSDFWGVEEAYIDLIDGGGLSLVLCHSQKGKAVFEKIINQCSGHEVDFEKAIKGNPSFFESYSRPLLRDDIENDIEKMSFRKLERKYANKKKTILKRAIKRLCFK